MRHFNLQKKIFFNLNIPAEQLRYGTCMHLLLLSILHGKKIQRKQFPFYGMYHHWARDINPESDITYLCSLQAAALGLPDRMDCLPRTSKNEKQSHMELSYISINIS